MTTEATTHVVSANVKASYDRRIAGETAKKIADDLGITPSSVSANYNRVKSWVDAGHTVTAEDGTTADATAKKSVDRYAIANGIMAGTGAAIVGMVDAAMKANDDIDRRITRMREEITALEARRTDIDAVRTVGTSAGFDWAAFDAAIADASKPDTPPSSDTPNASADTPTQ